MLLVRKYRGFQIKSVWFEIRKYGIPLCCIFCAVYCSQCFAILEFYFAFKNCMRVHTLGNIYTHVQTQGVKGYLSNYMVFYYACPPWSKTPRADIYLANCYLLLSRGKTRTYIHIWRNSLQTIYITSIMTWFLEFWSWAREKLFCFSYEINDQAFIQKRMSLYYCFC